jgi:thiamine biosynthesis lipoprotein
MKSITRKTIAVLILLSFLLITGCRQGYVYNEIRLTGAFRNAANTVKLFTEEKQSTEQLNTLKADMDKILIDLDKLFDIQGTYPNSELMQIKNQAGKNPVKVSAEVIYVLQAALQMSERSLVDGVALFDPTIAPVWKVWNFPINTYNIMENNELSLEEMAEIKAEVQALIAGGLVDYRSVEIDPEESTVFLAKEGMELDLGAIVKGYAADKIKEYLIEQGYSSAIIDIGGNIQTLGIMINQPFKVGIRTPFVSWFNLRYNDKGEAINQIYGTVTIADQTVVTSGSYEKYIQDEEGKTYHHILDPRNGLPINNNVISITVITNQSILADGYSTTLFALGLERGMELVNSTEGLETIWVVKNGTKKEIYLSAGLVDNFVFNKNVEEEGFIYKGVYNESTED